MIQLNHSVKPVDLVRSATDDARVLAKAREALATPSKYGHSDVGEAICSYLKGQETLDETIWFLEVAFLGKKL